MTVNDSASARKRPRFQDQRFRATRAWLATSLDDSAKKAAAESDLGEVHDATRAFAPQGKCVRSDVSPIQARQRGPGYPPAGFVHVVVTRAPRSSWERPRHWQFFIDHCDRFLSRPVASA